MENYISSFIDLSVETEIYTRAKVQELKADADSGDVASCLKMAMIFFLGLNGIKVNIDYDKAKKYLKKKELTNIPESHRFLALIAEYEGNCTEALRHYFKASVKARNNNGSIVKRVTEERRKIADYFSNQIHKDMPLNVEISQFLNNKADEQLNSIRIGYLCDDEPSCREEIANSFYEMGELYFAALWLKKANISKDNKLSMLLNDIISGERNYANTDDLLEIITLNNNTLLFDTSLYKLPINSTACVDLGKGCCEKWNEIVRDIRTTIETEARSIIMSIREEKNRQEKILWTKIIGISVVALFGLLWYLTSLVDALLLIIILIIVVPLIVYICI